MTEFSKVEGYPDLIRDNSTNAILNTNQSAYDAYIKMSNLKKDERNKSENLERDLKEVKEEINQVKSLLMELLNATR
jgi:hypothetical protein